MDVTYWLPKNVFFSFFLMQSIPLAHSELGLLMSVIHQENIAPKDLPTVQSDAGILSMNAPLFNDSS